MIHIPIFSILLPMIEDAFKKIVEKTKTHKNVGKGSDLYNVVIQTMCKIMIVNPKFSDIYSKEMFDLLDSTLHYTLKFNIITSYADMLKKYPSKIEIQINPIFECLKSQYFALRKVSVHLIVFLVLNDMIKLKNKVTDIILMMNDPEIEIRNIAKMFFYELHQKEP
jgi:non-SMC mitotic condensation complex subunit 1